MDKTNEKLQVDYPEQWNKGIKAVSCRSENRTTGKRIRRRRFIMFERPCGAQKEIGEGTFLRKNRVVDMNNFELCTNESCEECEPERFDYKEYHP